MSEKTLRIALGTTVLRHGRATNGIDGIGTYTDRLYAGLNGLGSQVSVTPFHFSGYRNCLRPEPSQLFPFAVGAAISSLAGISHIGISRVCSQSDIVHATDHLIPRCTTKPVVATIMDAIPLSHPEWIRVHFRPIKMGLWKKTARWADHIITISEHSKSEIHRWFNIPDERITAVPLGVGAEYFEELAPTQIESVRSSLQLPEKYFLVLGTIQPRKNVERIVEAHLSLPALTRRRFPLVVAGRYGWGAEELRTRLERASDDSSIRWLKYVTEIEKHVLLRSASALVFPSLCEGFGLPVLEAFARGTPLITSNSSAIPEVANRDNASIVDPTDTAAITEAMREIVIDPNSSVERARRAQRLAAEFTWERCTRETVRVYRSVV